MKFFGIFYFVSFILIVFFANINWGDHPANFIQRIICSVIGSFVFTLTFGMWLYGIMAFF